jgi:lipoate-protein ligase A
VPDLAPRSEILSVSVDDEVTCAEEFAADERALRLGGPSVRVAVLSEIAVSFGAGVREDAAYLSRARSSGLPVVRRNSGGTGVLHAPGDLAWSVVLPRKDPRVGRDFVRAYARLGAGAVVFLGRYGVTAEWVAPPNLSPDVCVLSGRGRVLAGGPRIFGGAAQHLSGSALLHQGMIHGSVDRALVSRLFDISDPAVTGRMVGLRELGVTAPPSLLAPELAAELRRRLSGTED